MSQMQGSGDRDSRTGRGRILFVGAVHEAEPALRAVLDAAVEVVGVYTFSEKVASRTAGFVDLEPMAREAGVPVFRTANLNSPKSIQRVRDLAPDLVVAVGWTRLLGDELLTIPSRGCVGFHASMLPRHRGRAPVNWAILRGESETGNTMMFLAPGADTGDIIDQRPVTIEPDDTCSSVYDKIGETGAAMLRAHLPALLTGTAPRRRQRHDDADLLPKRTPDMGITDWNRPARAVHDWVRALSHPYPGAFACLNGRRIHLWRSRLPEGGEPEWTPEPGTLMGLEGDALRVRTSGGSVLITRVQQEHEVEESGADWFVRKGHRRGERFDPVDAALARYALGLGPKPPEPLSTETGEGERS